MITGKQDNPNFTWRCFLFKTVPTIPWLVLSDEQMSKRWPFSLLNDEQMSNWVGVKHLPVPYWHFLEMHYFAFQTAWTSTHRIHVWYISLQMWVNIPYMDPMVYRIFPSNSSGYTDRCFCSLVKDHTATGGKQTNPNVESVEFSGQPYSHGNL